MYSTPIGLVGLPSKRKVQLRQSAMEKADDDGDDVDDDDDDDDGLWQQGFSRCWNTPLKINLSFVRSLFSFIHPPSPFMIDHSETVGEGQRASIVYTHLAIRSLVLLHVCGTFVHFILYIFICFRLSSARFSFSVQFVSASGDVFIVRQADQPTDRTTTTTNLTLDRLFGRFRERYGGT